MTHIAILLPEHTDMVAPTIQVKGYTILSSGVLHVVNIKGESIYYAPGEWRRLIQYDGKITSIIFEEPK